MSEAIKKCQANETAACCCVDVGTVIDNRDCTASWSQSFTQRHEAEEMLARLTAKARQVESEPCKIEARIDETAEGVHLTAAFSFACQAEALIFQLGLR
ncbi:YfcZ/YiiS family protein [[Erwinia] mediterraneensis]|uniref:YfcZ/YiiS family protein n=1 Tax=[Erwinia] mediterraneensis TaxID=2161819 RepID=UPI0010323C7E|nr:YfcZ/YiiS family protein [[Erwinia] mediterraneensis]